MEPSLYKSFLYANLIGTYFILISVIFLSRRVYYQTLMMESKPSAFSFMTIGLVLIFLGILFIHYHNIWLLKPRLIITLMCWLVFIKGIILVMFPEWSLAKYKKWVKSSYFAGTMIIILILCLILVIDSARLIVKVQKEKLDIFKKVNY